MLTVAATAALGRALFSRRVGLLGAAVLAVTLWHVHLSRVGFRAVLLPLFIALTVWQVALGVKGDKETRGQEDKETWHWVLAGVFYGLSFYTYTAARFTPVALAVFSLYVLAARSAIRNLQFALRPSLWRGIGVAGLAALVVLIPLAIYTAGNLEVVLGRLGQVSFLNPAINGGNPGGALMTNTLRTLGMFFVQGDRIWRHNVPWRPIFDPALGAAFVVGLLIALRRARRDTAAGFVLIWTAVMSLPTLLAEDAPHFLRAVGVLPVVVLLPALGLEQVGKWASGQVGKWVLPTPYSLLPIFYSLLLIFSLFSTVGAYFGVYAHDPMTGYWFEQGAVALAGQINGFMGIGEAEERQVYLAPELWTEWQPQLDFLIAAPEAVIIGREGESPDVPVAVFTWPYEDWRWAWSLLPAPSEITVEEGLLSQGDRDTEPYTTYLAFFAAPPDTTAPAIARFSGGVELLGVEVSPVAQKPGFSVSQATKPGFWVRLRWRATAPLEGDYTVFLHYVRDGERIAQADSRPAGGHYSTRHWRPGDVINDDHYVDGVAPVQPGCDVLLFGFWDPESQTVLYLLDEAGNPAGDWIEMPLNATFQ